ncbi:MAG: hypothetical protein WBD20_09790 [Pirellulaceae bacterium]
MLSQSLPGKAQAVEPSLAIADSIASLISQLESDSFLHRSQAKQELLRLANDHESELLVQTSLQTATLSASLEIHESASRLLHDIELRQTESETARLLDMSVSAESIRLPLWRKYSRMAGSDLQARKLFAKLVDQYIDQLRWLSRCDQTPEHVSTNRQAIARRVTKLQLSDSLDPYAIATDDAPLWALLFCVDDPASRYGWNGLTTRTTLALVRTGGGPMVGSQGDFEVISRMIAGWIEKSRNTGLDRERLMIALKFGCHQEAHALCDEVLNDPLATPSSHAMALLCASVLQRADLDQQLMRRIDDQRTAHVWQLIASRKTKIRTQVGDVALALLLHRRGIDPRDVGFVELQADPIVVFREHSLGFADETARQRAYANAQSLIRSVEN